MEQIKLKASKYLDWLMKDNESAEIIGRKTIERMKETGYGDLSAEDIFYNGTAEIPECICEGYTGTLREDECKQIYFKDVVFINDLKK